MTQSIGSIPSAPSSAARHDRRGISKRRWLRPLSRGDETLRSRTDLVRSQTDVAKWLRSVGNPVDGPYAFLRLNDPWQSYESHFDPTEATYSREPEICEVSTLGVGGRPGMRHSCVDPSNWPLGLAIADHFGATSDRYPGEALTSRERPGAAWTTAGSEGA